ncbi:MAG TPA: TetR/AcrR family transcriptional regulator [Phototrophicaceae bacterium]|nr:TetR/AcrR family transcriptional regulator [Phototrophicaceae bacterium]
MARKPADQSVNKDDILQAAAHVLQRNGYEATTMKDIAAEVNLTAASLYHHFRNKDALLLAVLEAGIELVISQIEPIVHSTATSDEKLRQMMFAHIVSLTRNTAVGAALVFEIKSLISITPPPGQPVDPDVAEVLERQVTFIARRDQFENLYRQVLHEGITAGCFRPVDVPIFVKTMLGAHNWVGVWYRPEGRLSGEVIAGMMADTFLRALQPT